MSQPHTKPRRSAWTPERRAKQAAAIKIWAPWARSTGPRTKTGKAKSSQNARKYSPHAPHRAVKKAMRAQAHYLSDMKRYLRLKKFFPQNELLKNERRRLLRKGKKVTLQLMAALAYAKLCKNLAISPPFPLKVNKLFAIAVTPAFGRVDAMELQRQ